VSTNSYFYIIQISVVAPPLPFPYPRFFPFIFSVWIRLPCILLTLLAGSLIYPSNPSRLSQPIPTFLHPSNAALIKSNPPPSITPLCSFFVYSTFFEPPRLILERPPLPPSSIFLLSSLSSFLTPLFIPGSRWPMKFLSHFAGAQLFIRPLFIAVRSVFFDVSLLEPLLSLQHM